MTTSSLRWGAPHFFALSSPEAPGPLTRAQPADNGHGGIRTRVLAATHAIRAVVNAASLAFRARVLAYMNLLDFIIK